MKGIRRISEVTPVMNSNHNGVSGQSKFKMILLLHESTADKSTKYL